MRCRPTWRAALVAALFCGVPLSTASAAPPPYPSIDVRPQVSFSDELHAVSASSATDIWAVGSKVTEHRFLQEVYVEHSSGKRWHQVPDAGPGGGAISSLLGVTALSSADAWAVGTYSDQSSHALAQHWDGSGWQNVPTADLGDVSNVSLESVSAVSPTDVWAVGGYQRDSAARTLVEHWDGTAWTQVPSPSPRSHKGVRLLGVTALSSTDVWAVGYTGIGTGQRGLIEHWDGVSWTVLDTPRPGGPKSGLMLRSVDAASPTDVWAVGTSMDADGSRQKGVTLHWDGASWSVVPSVNPSMSQTALYGVSAASATDVWAVGASGDKTFAQQWNGRHWHHVHTETPGDQATLRGVSAVTDSDAWTVGLTTEKTTLRQVIEHWDGTSWQVP